MRRKLIALAAICVLVCACLALQALAEREQRIEAASGGPDMQRIQQDFREPDRKHLEAYGLGEFTTNLPVVYIDTVDGASIKKESRTWSTLFVGNVAGNDGYSVMSLPQQEEAATINYRGASSYSLFEKKQYRIKFFKNQGSSKAKDVAFLNLGAASEWVLNGPYLDKTFMRNRLMYAVARDTMTWAPDTRYCELFLNGEYQGIYLLVEPITADPSRLDLTEYSLLSGACAFITKRDRIGTENAPLQTYAKTTGLTVNDLYVSSPSNKDITKQQYEYVFKTIDQFERALYTDDYDDPVTGYKRYIDLRNFATYLVLNEVAMIRDSGNLSTYCYKDLQGKLKMAVWDFNNGFNLYPSYYEYVNEWQVVENEGNWFYRMLADRAFVDEVVSVYRELRADALSDKSLLARLDTYEKELGDAVDRNFKVWAFSLHEILLVGDNPDGSSRGISSHEAAMKQLKDTMLARLAYMDEHIEDLYQYCEN